MPLFPVHKSQRRATHTTSHQEPKGAKRSDLHDIKGNLSPAVRCMQLTEDAGLNRPKKPSRIRSFFQTAPKTPAPHVIVQLEREATVRDEQIKCWREEADTRRKLAKTCLANREREEARNHLSYRNDAIKEIAKKEKQRRRIRELQIASEGTAEEQRLRRLEMRTADYIENMSFQSLDSQNHAVRVQDTLKQYNESAQENEQYDREEENFEAMMSTLQKEIDEENAQKNAEMPEVRLTAHPIAAFEEPQVNQNYDILCQ